MGGRLCSTSTSKRHSEVAPLAVGEPSPTNEKAQDNGKVMNHVKSRLRLILDYIARFKKRIDDSNEEVTIAAKQKNKPLSLVFLKQSKFYERCIEKAEDGEKILKKLVNNPAELQKAHITTMTIERVDGIIKEIKKFASLPNFDELYLGRRSDAMKQMEVDSFLEKEMIDEDEFDAEYRTLIGKMPPSANSSPKEAHVRERVDAHAFSEQAGMSANPKQRNILVKQTSQFAPVQKITVQEKNTEIAVQ